MQTIGERLEEARKRKSVSLREAAEATKIRGDYLQKFESNQFNIGLTDIYVRGFLRNYATFLGLPGERIVNDYESLGQSDTRPRTPSREVYGRMDLSVSSGGDRGSAEGPATESAGAAAAADGSSSPRPTLRPHASGLPPVSRINPAVAFKALFGLVAVIALLFLIWLVKTLFSGSSHHAAEARSDAATNSVATSSVAAPDADAPLTLIAVEPVSLQVYRQSDNVSLFFGQMARGERKDFPNVGLHVVWSAIENLHIRFGGVENRFDAKGRVSTIIPVQK
jgi:cytoskeleton protein RodZ